MTLVLMRYNHHTACPLCVPILHSVGDVFAGDGGAAAEEGPGQPKASHLPTVWTSTDARLAAAWDASLTSEQRTILHERLAWQQVRCRALPLPTC